MHRLSRVVPFLLLFAAAVQAAPNREVRATVVQSAGPEGNAGTTTLTLTLTQTPQNFPITYNYQTVDGTATAADNDYVPTSGSIVIPANETTGSFTVQIVGDTKVESNEVFTVQVSNFPNGPFELTILNDDVVAFAVSSPSVLEGNAGTSTMTFNVTLPQAAAVQVRATYTTEDGTATAGQDYVAAQGSLVFEPGETTQAVPVTINGDATFEPDETFTLAVTPTVPAGGAASRSTGTILNDDIAPPSSVTIVSGNSQQGILGLRLAQPLIVEVRDARGNPAAGVTVQWRVVPGSGSATLTPTTSTTDAQGRASTTVTLNSVGSIVIEATVAGLTPARFTVGSSTSLEARATGPVAVPIARVLDGICARNEETFAAACRELAGLADAEVTPALERVAPQPSGAQSKVASEVVSAVTAGIANRLAAVRSGTERFSIQGLSFFHNGRAVPVATLASAFLPQATDAGAPEDDYNGWSAFLSGNLGDGERIARDGQIGFDLQSRGVMFGVDRIVGHMNSSGIIGASVNWMSLDSDLDDGVGSVDTTGYALSVYASRSGLFTRGAPGSNYDGVHVDGSVTVGRNTYDSEHMVEFGGGSIATSENDATVFAVSGGAGIEAHRGRSDFDFSLSGTWSRADIDDLTEDGTGPLILFVQGHEIESLVATAGLSMRAAVPVAFGTLLPSFRAEMVHEFKAGARLVTARFIRDTLGTSFTIPLDRPDANYGKLAAGLQAEFPYGWSAFAEVTQDVLRSDLHFRTLQFTLRKAF